MSELLPELDPVSLEISVNGLALYLTHQNTTLYTFPRFPFIDHVYHRYPNPEQPRDANYAAIFNSPGLVTMLRKLYFPEDIRPQPTKWDEEAYLSYERNKLSVELDDFDLGGQ